MFASESGIIPRSNSKFHQIVAPKRQPRDAKESLSRSLSKPQWARAGAFEAPHLCLFGLRFRSLVKLPEMSDDEGGFAFTFPLAPHLIAADPECIPAPK